MDNPYISHFQLESRNIIHFDQHVICSEIEEQPMEFTIWETPNKQIAKIKILPLELAKLLLIWNQGKNLKK